MGPTENAVQIDSLKSDADFGTKTLKNKNAALCANTTTGKGKISNGSYGTYP